jgi:hypothetical protein
MEEKIETRVSPEKVWQAWEIAHANHESGAIAKGRKGKSGAKNGRGFKYEILDVVKGERFSLVWKTLFLRLIFSQSVSRKKRGSEIKYSIQIRGLFAAPVRWFLGNKIRYNIRQVLKTMVRRLEDEL